MKSIAKKTFKSPIGIDNGYVNSYQGEHESTMELFAFDGFYQIEWCVDALDIVEHIGLWFEHRTLTDYDGVFELPAEAISLLRSQGFEVPKEFESN